MLSLRTKERKAKVNNDDLIYRKKFSLPFGSLPSAECSSIEYNSAELLKSLTNKYKLFGTKSKQTVNFFNIPNKPFPLTPSKKYIMIEEFNDELKGLKNILNEIEKLGLVREQDINEIKNYIKRKLNMLEDEINYVLRKLYVDLATLRLKCDSLNTIPLKRKEN